MLPGESGLLLQLHQVCHCQVHHLCALAAKGGNHQRTAVQPQFFPGGSLIRPEEFLPDGHAHSFGLLRMLIVLGAFREADQHPVCPGSCHAGSQAGHGVGLMDTGGDLHQLARQQRREAGIAAGTHDHIGLEFFDNLLAAGYGADRIGHRLNIGHDTRQIQLPAHTGCGESAQFVACRRHQFLFHVAGCADEENIAVGVAFFPCIGNCNGRINMAAGTTAGKNHIHRKSSCFLA